MGKKTTERLHATVELDGESRNTTQDSFAELTTKLTQLAYEDTRRVLWDTLELSVETEVDEEMSFAGSTHTEHRMLTGSVLAVKL